MPVGLINLLANYKFIYLFIHLFIYLSIYLLIYLFIYLFIHLFIYSIHQRKYTSKPSTLLGPCQTYMIEYVWKSPKNLIHSCAQSISLSKMPGYGISLTSIFPDNTILFLYGKIAVRENQILAYFQQCIFMIFKEENVRANFQILTKICFDLRCSTLIKK